MRERGNAYLRWADRYLGIPLVAGLSLFRRKRAFPSTLQRIALLKSAGIGDLVLLSALVADLRAAYPHVPLTLFTGQANQEMGRLISGVEVVALPITRPWEALARVRRQSFSLWIDGDSWPRLSALLSFGARAEYRVGFCTQGQGRHWLYDGVVLHRHDCHELENLRSLVRACNIPAMHFPTLSPIKQFSSGSTIFPSPSNLVVLHLHPGGSQAKAKMWPISYWEKLYQLLISAGYTVVCTGSARDRPALEALPEARNLAGLLTLEQTASLLVSARCLVSVDTGIMHLGAALGCPVVALHGPTSPKRWGGIGPSVISLTPPPPYYPYISLGFERGDLRCCSLTDLSVEQVWTAVQQQLNLSE